MDRVSEQYQLWVEKANLDADIINELQIMRNDRAKIEDAFYKDLEFGTGGLRGIIGAGTNRMNVFTVARISQGLACYLKKHFEPNFRKIAVSYDSRIKSKRFARTAAEVLAANGIDVFIYDELMPTPCLSFAVRRLGCAAGIMVTASHNPSQYNGYKIYNADGCQITEKATSEIFEEIEKVDIFNDIQIEEYEKGLENGKIQYIPDNVYDDFVEAVKEQSTLGAEINADINAAIIYSPLNGAGLKPVIRVLEEKCFTNISIVNEQERPDGTFPTCPYPNPEIEEAMALGIKYAREKKADIFLATDPDCDRVAAAVRNSRGEYVLLSGNETGILLLDYICGQRKRMGKMPDDPILIKTIVTTDMAERIAAHYGLRTINVLTGFKFIGEQIGRLEQEGKGESFVFGFEESCGYLCGSFVRDKDAVSATLLICEMFAYYKSIGLSLLEKLESLYSEYGYCMNTLHFYEFDGLEGNKRIGQVMESFRSGIAVFGMKRVEKSEDYLSGINGLPCSDVLKLYLEDNCFLVVRPSGTEPKLKVYISISAASRQEAMEKETLLVKVVENFIEKSLSS